MRPVVHRLEDEYWNRVDFVYLDREDDGNSDVVREYGISGQPVFILLDASGSEVQRWFGRVDVNTLRDAMDAVSG